MLPFRCRRSSRRKFPVAARRGPRVEALEGRDLPSVTAVPMFLVSPVAGVARPFGSPGPTGYTPTQIRHAYGFDQISLPGVASPDGSGTTIAVVDAFDDPNIASDLHQFDLAFGLPDPVFTKLNQRGGTSLPPPDAGWSTEIAIDVEWAHAIAPKANLLLVEADDNSGDNLAAAVGTAAAQPGVVAVSMSWGGGEFPGEGGYDHYFTTPPNQPGVTFLASSGDSGAPPSWPAVSANVVAVGGTTLYLTGANTIGSESGWFRSSGGPSAYLPQPPYQAGVDKLDPARGNPDVAYDADPSTGFPVYDTVNNPPSAPWVQYGGTSVAAPQWAGLVAIADQGRAAAGKPPLDGPTGTLPTLYHAAQQAPGDFHDVTAGSSEGFPPYNAGPGYDYVTGVGTPVANLLVPDLVAAGNSLGTPATSFRVAAPSGTVAGAPFSVTVTALDSSGNPVTGYAGHVHFTSSDAQGTLPPDYTFGAADNGTHTFPVTLGTAGGQTVTVGDVFVTRLTGSATVSVTAAGASRFVVTGFPSPVTAGSPGTFTVTAADAYGNPNPAYAGTVRFTSTDPRATLPANATLQKGVGTFTAVLRTAGSQALTAADTQTRTFTGSQTGIAVNPSFATHLAFGQQPTSTGVGTPILPAVTVQVEDAYNNVVTADGTDRVTLALGANPGGATLSGGGPVTVRNGVAVFGSVTLSKTGTGYTLVAHSGTLAFAISGPFNVTATSSGSVIEDFENVAAHPYTVTNGPVNWTTSLAAAHDGTLGLLQTDGTGPAGWMYRNDAGSLVKPGESISVWLRFAGGADGEASFGVGASANGTMSLIAAADTGSLILEHNLGWFGTGVLGVTGQSYQANHWYRLEIVWGLGGAVTGNLYDSDGTTLLNTVSGSDPFIGQGGIAFRSTGSGKDFDTVTVKVGGLPHAIAVPGVGPQAGPGPVASAPAVPSGSPAVADPATLIPRPAPVAVGHPAGALALNGAALVPPATASVLPAPALPLPAVPPGHVAAAVPTPASRPGPGPLDGGGSASYTPGADDGAAPALLLDRFVVPGEPAQVPTAPGPAEASPGTAPAPAASGVDAPVSLMPVPEAVRTAAGLPAAEVACVVLLGGLWGQEPDGDVNRRGRLA